MVNDWLSENLVRRRAVALARVAALALVVFSTSKASASTSTCTFGASSGVALRDGTWQHGNKPGTTIIRYRRDGDSARGARQADGEDTIFGHLIIAERSMHFITTWGPAPGSVVETTTIEARDGVVVAVRSVHVVAGFASPSVLVDYGNCTSTP